MAAQSGYPPLDSVLSLGSMDSREPIFAVYPIFGSITPNYLILIAILGQRLGMSNALLYIRDFTLPNRLEVNWFRFFSGLKFVVAGL